MVPKGPFCQNDTHILLSIANNISQRFKNVTENLIWCRCKQTTAAFRKLLNLTKTLRSVSHYFSAPFHVMQRKRSYPHPVIGPHVFAIESASLITLCSLLIDFSFLSASFLIDTVCPNASIWTARSESLARHTGYMYIQFRPQFSTLGLGCSSIDCEQSSENVLYS